MKGNKLHYILPYYLNNTVPIPTPIAQFKTMLLHFSKASKPTSTGSLLLVKGQSSFSLYWDEEQRESTDQRSKVIFLFCFLLSALISTSYQYNLMEFLKNKQIPKDPHNIANIHVTFGNNQTISSFIYKIRGVSSYARSNSSLRTLLFLELQWFCSFYLQEANRGCTQALVLQAVLMPCMFSYQS